MDHISTVAIILALLIGEFLYLYFHEYVHWTAGKMFSGDPNVLYDSWYIFPYPYAVEYRNLEHMSNWGVRIAGISPHFVWTSVAISYLVDGISVIDVNPLLMIQGIIDGMYSTPFLELIFITASAAAAVSVSPSDLVAAVYPHRYRKYTGRELSHREWLYVLVGRYEQAC